MKRNWRLSIALGDDDGDVHELAETIEIDTDDDDALKQMTMTWIGLAIDFFDEKEPF